jgi:hypothetical protein
LEGLTFSLNSGNSGGNDIYDNNTLVGTYFKVATVTLCCSLSTLPRFSLADGNDINTLLPSCSTSERYVSASGASDTQNNCTV